MWVACGWLFFRDDNISFTSTRSFTGIAKLLNFDPLSLKNPSVFFLIVLKDKLTSK